VYLSLGEILTLFLFAVLCLYFLASIRVRELATQAVKRASEKDDYQLLDQAVHLRKISMSRDDSGRWCVWRQYRFDYSYDGVERRQGHVIMLSKRLQAIIVSEREYTVH
jgi:Protein of unknown function (DUF3301)